MVKLMFRVLFIIVPGVQILPIPRSGWSTNSLQLNNIRSKNEGCYRILLTKDISYVVLDVMQPALPVMLI